MSRNPTRAVLAIVLALTASCGKPSPVPHEIPLQGETGLLFTIGTVRITQADLDYHLREKFGGRHDDQARQQALDALASQARLTQAAMDAGLDRDPAVRAETARVLSSGLKEQQLFPQLKALGRSIPEARLRELYAAAESRFRSPEKRQVAVLWLNPNGNPERVRQYQEKLAAARDWVAGHPELKDHPEQGFSVLGVDYSEHQASRYQGGNIGWLEAPGGSDVWTKAVAEIAFALHTPGEVSSVITRSEGVFLVRYLAQKPASVRPFESVRSELEAQEISRLRNETEARFKAELETKYPIKPAHVP